MTKRIEVEVEGTRATFALEQELTPKTAAALWEALPIEAQIRHGKLSGDACYFSVEGGPLAELPEAPELGATSIYRGYLAVVRSGPRSGGRRSSTELLISYGLAEYRWPTGRRYVTPVAEIEGDGSALFEVLRRTHAEGEKKVAVRRVDG